MRFQRFHFFSLAAALLAAGAAQADQLPLWEAGLGVGLMHVPDYRGADQSRNTVLPVPYLIYRGDFFKADRDGIRGILFATERSSLNISLNATLPVNSRRNRAREGMESLKPTVELGPTLDTRLWQSEKDRLRLSLRLPLRTAITVESSPKQIGWLFSPNLDLNFSEPLGWTGWKGGVSAGPIFTSRKYNEHFYSVGAQDVRADRPLYQAKSGYAGSQVTLGLTKRFPGYWVGGFVRYDSVAGASFRDSPLVKQNNAVSAGIGISWILGESSTRVEAAY